MTTTHRRRFLVHGANALVATIASVGIAVVGYVLVDRYRPFRLDMTASGLYGLSPRTLGILDDLEGEVSVTYFEMPGSEGPEAGMINTRVQELLEEYRVRGRGKIHVQVVNPLREALLLQELGADYGSTVFRRGEEKVIVQGKEVFEANMDAFGGAGPQVKFTGEEAFSSALVRLAEGATHVVCFLSGHGEVSVDNERPDGYSGLAETLRSDNFTSRPLVLDAGGGAPEKLDGPIALDGKVPPVPAEVSVPADCSVLVIAGPSKGALSDAEIDAVGKHFESGRGVVLLAEPLARARVEELVKRFGLEMLPGVVLDPKRMVKSPVYVVPDWARHAITDPAAGAGIGAVLPDTAAFKPAADPDPSVALTPLMTSSPASVVVVDIKDGRANPDSDKNIPGPATLGFAVERTLPDGKVARAVVLGDADFATNAILEAFGAGNLLLAENAVSWASGGRKKLDIGPKDPGFAAIGAELTETGGYWILFSTALMIPATILSTGAWVWVRRRSR